MAEVNFFDNFETVWGTNGAVEAIDENQYEQGWAFIGATPPSVEQFNKVQQLSDQKAAWLFRQLQTLTDDGNIELTAGLVDALSLGIDARVRKGGQVSGVVGQCRNLRMSVTTASGSATLTADEVIVQTALGGHRYCVPNLNEAINLATTGAGGMDAGSAPASGFVAVYAIYNPETGDAALLATNATAAVQPEVYGGANMPSGYTASALVSVRATTAGGQFAVAHQTDRQVSFPFATAATTSSGGVGSPTPINVAALVPRNAKQCSGWATVVSNGSSYANVNISASSTLIGLQQIAGPSIGGSGTTSGAFSMVPIVTSQTIYWSTTATGGSFTSASIYISGYSF